MASPVNFLSFLVTFAKRFATSKKLGFLTGRRRDIHSERKILVEMSPIADYFLFLVVMLVRKTVNGILDIYNLLFYFTLKDEEVVGVVFDIVSSLAGSRPN